MTRGGRRRGAGRPPLPPGDRRSVRLTAHVTEAERAELDVWAGDQTIGTALVTLALEAARLKLAAAKCRCRAAAAVATRIACCDFLAEVDPDGTWDPSEPIETLRAHTADLAVQGVIDATLTAIDVTVMLGRV